MIEIKVISIEEALPLRQEVLWPNKPLSYVKIDNDDQGIHLGLFDEGVLCTVISVFVEDGQAQFRKFATLEAHRGKGYGSKLFKYMLDYLDQLAVDRIWCNARVTANDFYKKYGFKVKENTTFYKGHVAYTIMEKFMD